MDSVSIDKKTAFFHQFLIPKRTFLPLKAAPYGLGALTGGIASNSILSSSSLLTTTWNFEQTKIRNTSNPGDL